jgi:hypothetical protein
VTRAAATSVAALLVVVVGFAGTPRVHAGILPVAVNDAYSAVHGKLRTVAAPGVLGNDLQIGGGFSADLTNDVDHGMLDLDPDGGFTYRSDASFVGTDSFRYRVDGGLLGLSNIAIVTITVTNAAPVATPDGYSAIADVERSVAAPGVLGNDGDADGDPLQIKVVQEPAHGDLNESSDGGFRYKADRGFSGIDTWTYRATDGFTWSNIVTVTMTVTDPSPTPRPTPSSTPQPTPTPAPTPTVTATIIPLPTNIPLPTIIPEPTPTPTPVPSDRPSPTPTVRPTPSDDRHPMPSPGSSGGGGSGAPGGPVASHGAGPSGPPASGGPATSQPVDTFVVPAAERATDIALAMDAASFGGFEWAVPALVLTVPGVLIVLAVLVQAAIGLFWLPVIRRWLAGDRRRRTGLVSSR